MTQSPAPLTVTEAEALVLSRLKARDAAAELSIVPGGNSERSFGWVFEIAVSGGAVSASPIPRGVIVNKYSRQVVASSAEYDIEQFVRRYEKLLADHQARSAQWCGTLPPPWPWKLWRKKSVAEQAKDDGFYEIGAKEGES